MCARGEGAQLDDGMMGHRVGQVVLDLVCCAERGKPAAEVRVPEVGGIEGDAQGSDYNAWALTG